jgi:hypothetical protein
MREFGAEEDASREDITLRVLRPVLPAVLTAFAVYLC